MGKAGQARTHRLKSVPTLGPDADDGHQAAGGGAFLAVGEEEVWAAGGTEVDGVDILGAEAGR